MVKNIIINLNFISFYSFWIDKVKKEHEKVGKKLKHSTMKRDALNKKNQNLELWRTARVIGIS
jgi:hypothetical protein